MVWGARGSEWGPISFWIGVVSRRVVEGIVSACAAHGHAILCFECSDGCLGIEQVVLKYGAPIFELIDALAVAFFLPEESFGVLEHEPNACDL
jgi:hypothetical protein